MSNHPSPPIGFYPQTPQGGLRKCNIKVRDKIEYNVQKNGGETKEEFKVPPGGFRGGFQLAELAGSNKESGRGTEI